MNKTIDIVISYEGVDKSEMDPYTKYKLLNRTHPMKLITKREKISQEWNLCKVNLKKKSHLDHKQLQLFQHDLLI